MEVLNRRRTRGMTFLKKDAFFDLVAAEAGFLPREVVERVYWALVRITCRELRKGGMVRLPDFGDFTLRFQKARKTFMAVNGKRSLGHLPERRTMRFDPDYKLRDYWRMLDTGVSWYEKGVGGAHRRVVR